MARKPTTPTKPGIVIKRVKIDTLKPDPQNPRTHDETNIAAIAASLDAFTQVEPLVVQKGTGRIIAGHGRLEAMRRRGDTEADINEVDVTDEQATAMGIALNRTTDLSSFDLPKLAGLLESLPPDLLGSTGYTTDAMQEMLDELNPPAPTEDEAPDVLAEAVSKTGDLWILGKHRLLTGDSTKPEDVARLMGDELAQFCFTDPPYGVKYTGGTKKWRMLENDDEVNMYAACLPGIRAATTPQAALYLAFASNHGRSVYNAIAEGGYEPRAMIVWNKNHAQFGAMGSQYKQKHEPVAFTHRPDMPIVYGHKKNQTPHWYGPANEVTVWDIKRSSKNEYHPTQKPVELVARAMQNSAPPACLVYEPFSGSGTAIVTAEQMRRRCNAIEIEPRYVDVAIRRWQNLTGKEAVLESTGKTWRATAKARKVAVPDG